MGYLTWLPEDTSDPIDSHADEGRCYCRLCIMSAGATDTVAPGRLYGFNGCAAMWPSATAQNAQGH